MGSSVDALVSRSSDALEPIAVAIGSRCVDLAQGFVLMPIPHDVMPDDWRDAFEEFSYLPADVAAAAGRAAATHV